MLVGLPTQKRMTELERIFKNYKVREFLGGMESDSFSSNDIAIQLQREKLKKENIKLKQERDLRVLGAV